ncbi:MAG: hypothetical protein ABI824_01475, partial [Acidobacteriota bacterium]
MLSHQNSSVRGLTLALVVLLTGCENSAQVVQKSHAETKPVESLPASREANDIGRFIAGLPGTEGSPLATLEQLDAWKEHRRQLDSAWGKAQSPMISGLQGFQKSELNDEATRKAPVFYPFGGPDALTIRAWFPESPTYVMVALEPAGTLPGINQLSKKAVPNFLGETRQTVASILSRSFFITREMDRQFRGQVTDGLLLPILHLLVRTDNTILGYRYVRVDLDGNVVERPADYKSADKYANKGVELEFRNDKDQTTHILYYFSVNLDDEHLAENKGFTTYMATLKGSNTLLKSTSYMPHHKDFSMIRDQILSVSRAVLQDDSGIPYQYFTPADWDTQVYGEYTHPYGSFRWLEQPDLKKAYAKSAKPLSLRVGYG